jgi:ADP-heptose:LPS heptosyltransferase
MKKRTFIERMFSLYNEKSPDRKVKVLSFLGIRFVIQSRKLVPTAFAHHRQFDADFFKTQHKTREILAIKIDSIGDYVLMRNFWHEMKRSAKYKDIRLTVMVSDTIRGLAPLDAGDVDEFLFVPHNFWYNQRHNYGKIIDDLFRQGMHKAYDEIIMPSYNRSIFMDFYDTLMPRIFAKSIVMQRGDANQDLRPRCATRIISDPSTIHSIKFEFDMNRHFFENLTGQEIFMDRPHIDARLLPAPKLKLPDRYAVINPGAQEYFRVWDIRNLARLAYMLCDEYGLPVVLLSSPEHKESCECIAGLTKADTLTIADMSLTGAMSVMKGAEIYIGNDTGTTHIAMALDVKTIYLQCNMFSVMRFGSYPENPHYQVVVPRGIREVVERLRSEDRFWPTHPSHYAWGVNEWFESVNMNDYADVEAAVKKLIGGK